MKVCGGFDDDGWEGEIWVVDWVEWCWQILFKVSESGLKTFLSCPDIFVVWSKTPSAFFTFSLPYQLPIFSLILITLIFLHSSIYFDHGLMMLLSSAIVHSKSIIFSNSALILFVLACYKYSSNHRYSLGLSAGDRLQFVFVRQGIFAWSRGRIRILYLGQDYWDHSCLMLMLVCWFGKARYLVVKNCWGDWGKQLRLLFWFGHIHICFYLRYN